MHDLHETDAQRVTKLWKEKWNGFLKGMKIGNHHKDIHSTTYLFSLMLRLYAQQPVVQEMKILYRNNPERFINYVPQFVNFALHGAQEDTLDALECFLTEKSEKSLRFAHRLYWFIRSFSPVDMSGMLVETSSKLAERACKQLSHLDNKTSIPLDTDEQVVDFRPVRPLARFAAGPPHVLGVSNFEWAISFFDEFTNMGEALKNVPETERLKMLRATLDGLCEDYFPTDYMYLPIGNRASRIVNVVSSESFCFKTNTRVPFLVCFEVVDDPLSDYEYQAHQARRESLEGTSLMEETFQKIKHKITRTISTSSASDYTAADHANLSAASGHVRFPSVEMSPMKIENSGEKDDDSSKLGQWAPRVPTKGRGSGFSHFQQDQGFEFEHIRDSARKLALAQHSSSGRFSEIDLDANPPQHMRSFSQDSNPQHRISEEKDADIISDDGLVIDHEEEDEDDDDQDTTTENIVFKERWAEKQKRIAKTSKWSHLSGWRIVPMIVKSGDDLRQEQFASQLIGLFNAIFEEEGLSLWLHPYDVLATSPDCGLIEAVSDTISLDSLKKNDPYYTNLKDFFIRYFGKPKSAAYKKAVSNFCESLAAYCIVCYILQIKDRHNGNLLLDADGRIIHIDFGFILSSLGPGNMNFEKQVPFKLTSEFVQLLGGPDSALFRRFRSLCCKGYLAARKHREAFVLMVEMMLSGENSELECFQAGGEQTIRELNERFSVDKSRAGCISFVNDLIDSSIAHPRMKIYDFYQYMFLGISA